MRNPKNSKSFKYNWFILSCRSSCSKLGVLSFGPGTKINKGIKYIFNKNDLEVIS
jgi:hypothetical protein